MIVGNFGRMRICSVINNYDCRMKPYVKDFNILSYFLMQTLVFNTTIVIYIEAKPMFSESYIINCMKC